VANLWRVLYLVVIPVFRGLLVALQGDLSRWLQGAWLDIIILLLMVGIAVWRWWVVTYTCDDDAIHIRSGMIVRKHARVPWNQIVSLSLVSSFYLRPFRAAHLRADTLGGSFKDADFSFLISARKGRGILNRYASDRTQQLHRGYTPTTASVLAMALLTSNSLAGIVFIAGFISTVGKLLGEEFSRLIIGTFENLARALTFGVPPAAAALAYALLIGWFIGFLITFFRYKNFSVVRRTGRLSITGGIFTNREYSIQYDRVNFIDIRQSAITKLLRLYSLYISAVGYGKQKDDISCIIPTEGKQTFIKNRDLLFPALEPHRRQVYPHRNGVMRFIGAALSWCGGISAAMLTLAWLFPKLQRFILFVGLMLLIPALYLLVIRLIDFFTGGVSVREDSITLRYSKGLSLHVVVIPWDKIVELSLRQGMFQKFGHNCDLYIFTTSETRTKHHCRSLDKQALAQLLHLKL